MSGTIVERPCEACGEHTVKKYRGHLAAVSYKDGLVELVYKMHESFSEFEVSSTLLGAVQTLYCRLAQSRNTTIQKLCQLDRSIQLCDEAMKELAEETPPARLKVVRRRRGRTRKAGRGRAR
jgi:hypothetical protein